MQAAALNVAVWGCSVRRVEVQRRLVWEHVTEGKRQTGGTLPLPHHPARRQRSPGAFAGHMAAWLNGERCGATLGQSTVSSPARTHLVVPLPPPHVVVEVRRHRREPSTCDKPSAHASECSLSSFAASALPGGLLVPNALHTFWAFIQSATGGSVYRRVKIDASRRRVKKKRQEDTPPQLGFGVAREFPCQAGSHSHNAGLLPRGSLWRFISRCREHPRTRALWGTGPVRQCQALGGMLSCTTVAQLAPCRAGVKCQQPLLSTRPTCCLLSRRGGTRVQGSARDC